MIQFNCENCGREISVQDKHVGKRGKCPECGYMVVIPSQAEVSTRKDAVVQFACSTCNRQIEEPESSRGKLVPCPHCSTYVAVPLPEISLQKDEPSIQLQKADDTSEEQFDQLQIGSIRTFKQEPNVVTERKLPWVLDIFLFPTSMSGMSVLAIVVFTRFFFRVSVLYLGQAAEVFLPCLAPFGLMVGLGIFVRIVLYMYLCWYLCECIRGSAEGGVRAVETKGYNPGLWEMFVQTFRVVLCMVLYLIPAIIYLNLTKRADAIFWSLFIFGMVFLPMSFIGIAIYETLRGMNPVLVIGSIFTAFLPYFAMILMFVAAGFLIVSNVSDPYASNLSFFVTWLVGVYLLMVVAHVLGWFYHRYEEKLDWDV